MLLSAVDITLRRRDGTPVPSVICVARAPEETDALAWDLTGPTGVAALQLADGEYRLRFGPAPYDFDNPYPLTVSGPTSLICVCDAVSPVVGGLGLAEMRGNLDGMVHRLYGADARYITPAFLDQWLNSAYQEVDRKLRWTRCNYEFATVAEQAEYVIPVEVREVLAAEYLPTGASRTLREISLDEYLDRRAASAQSGDPAYFMHHGDKTELYPAPRTEGEVVKLWIVTEPPNLAADGDRPGFPAHLHQRVVSLALSYALEFMGQYADGQRLREALLLQLEGERREPAVHRSGSNRLTTSGP